MAGMSSSPGQCLKPGCREAVEFRLLKIDDKLAAYLYSCAMHTDLFHELVLAVKYGTWKLAALERVVSPAPMIMPERVEEIIREYIKATSLP